MLQRILLSRRRLLGSLLTGMALLQTTAIARAFSSFRSVNGEIAGWERELRVLVADLALDRSIGQAYLEKFPDDASIDRLQARLFGAGIPNPPGTVRALVLAAEQEDYRVGRLVCLNGWLLSRTSVTVAALSVMMAEAPAA